MTITERVGQLVAARTPFVHATVVRAEHPTSAQPGDEAIVLPDGTIEGFVGGQCAQNSVRQATRCALQTGESVLLRVLPDGEEHFPNTPGAAVVVNPCLSGGALEIFLAPWLPAPLIGIVGTAPIADKLADACAVVGFEVRRENPDTLDDLDQLTAVVIASHGGPEAATIRAAVDAGVRYIGLVASRTRGAALLSELTLSEDERARVHTPVGLEIHAKTPGEIAVAIVAELIRDIRAGGLRIVAPVIAPPPATAVDPVCGMPVTIGPGTEHLRVSEEDHWFCGPVCQASFAATRLH